MGHLTIELISIAVAIVTVASVFWWMRWLSEP
jgi:hypothetical protein